MLNKKLKKKIITSTFSLAITDFSEETHHYQKNILKIHGALILYRAVCWQNPCILGAYNPNQVMLASIHKTEIMQ